MKINHTRNTVVIVLYKHEARSFVRDLEEKVPNIALGIVDEIGDKIKVLLEGKPR